MFIGVLSLFTLPALILNAWVIIQTPRIETPKQSAPIEERSMPTVQSETLKSSPNDPEHNLTPIRPEPTQSLAATPKESPAKTIVVIADSPQANTTTETIPTEPADTRHTEEQAQDVDDILHALKIVKEKYLPLEFIAKHAPFGLPSDSDLDINSNYIASVNPDTKLPRWICFSKDNTTTFLSESDLHSLAGFWKLDSTVTPRLDKISSSGLSPFIYHPLPHKLVQLLETSNNWELLTGEARIDGIDERFTKDTNNPLVRIIGYVDELSQSADSPLFVCIAFDYETTKEKTTLKHLTAILSIESADAPIPLVFNVKHKSKRLTRNLLSVDDAEKRHDIDLFSELDTEIQSKMESPDTKRFWDSFFENTYPSTLIEIQ